MDWQMYNCGRNKGHCEAIADRPKRPSKSALAKKIQLKLKESETNKSNANGEPDTESVDYYDGWVDALKWVLEEMSG